MEVVYVLFWGVIWGIICQVIGKSKNINGFWLRFLLGVIGLIGVLCSKSKKDITEIEEFEKEKSKLLN